ncbi:flagellar biosynthetic protein FliQ [Paracoccus kondratievae]|uniref:Flagellar biosynthetic protein FliQ n=1 Tax=Paracoccus kondratievae TaxID=135740 RepID=A0AAD3RV30_9RHOB|nr:MULTISPECIES: flagellar biosynthetic protein FliQ [Paracoccus]QFQ87461.1 flagellar biosynthetic protein FliQ [Paracoccus kondratievae]GLK65401.1 flagellar biosynthetic protein FliQ [Paracoccus kondratievae]SMG52479.1 flagellar biosynthetic protein FliQ [Paracoccus sp. J56]
MDENLIFDLTRQALWIALRMAAPLLGVALVVGVIIGLLQALTSVQEMTLTFVPKVGLMLAVFWVSMSFMTAMLTGFFTDQVLPGIAGS